MKKKILAFVLAFSLAFALTSCGIKNWFEDKINGKDSQQIESVIDSSMAESETSEEGKDVVSTAHADIDYNNVCDHCNVATSFEEVVIVNGEKATGNWYRIYVTFDSEGGSFNSGGIRFSDGQNEFSFSYDEDNDIRTKVNLQVYEEYALSPTIDDTGIFTFYEGVNDKGDYFDVYLENGKTFTIKQLISFVNDNGDTDLTWKDITFTLDENVVVDSLLFTKEVYRLETVVEETVVEDSPVCDEHIDEDNDGYCDVCGSVNFSTMASDWFN